MTIPSPARLAQYSDAILQAADLHNSAKREPSRAGGDALKSSREEVGPPKNLLHIRRRTQTENDHDWPTEQSE